MRKDFIIDNDDGDEQAAGSWRATGGFTLSAPAIPPDSMSLLIFLGPSIGVENGGQRRREKARRNGRAARNCLAAHTKCRGGQVKKVEGTKEEGK